MLDGSAFRERDINTVCSRWGSNSSLVNKNDTFFMLAAIYLVRGISICDLRQAANKTQNHELLNVCRTQTQKIKWGGEQILEIILPEECEEKLKWNTP